MNFEQKSRRCLHAKVVNRRWTPHLAQSHELSTLAQNNITELNYSTGQFTQGGAQRTLALADLGASSAGVVSQQHKYYEIDSKVNRFYAGYLPQTLQKEARNDQCWRSAA